GTTVVTEGGGGGEGLVEPAGPGDRHRHLADLDGVGQPGAEVVVVGGEVDLALARQAPEGPAVLDAVEVALEAGTGGVGVLRRGPVAGARRPRRHRGEGRVLPGLPLDPAP